MSLFIDLVETFDFYTITSEEYSEKIDGLLKRFPKFKKDCRYRTVVPQKLAKSAGDYISIKLCTKGRVPVYGIYTKRDLHLAVVCVEGIMYALDHASCTDLHASFVPDLKFRKVDLGIQRTPLAGTSMILESWGSNSDASGSFLLFRRHYPLYRESFLEALRAAYRAIADCMCPVFTAAEFSLCARRHKFKVDEMKLIELCATSKSEFNRVSTSMKDLCFDNCGISEEKTDPRKVNGNQEPRPFVQLGCGGVSGALGATRVYLLQDITTRMQAQHFAANAGYSGMFDVFRRTIPHEGLRLRGFYPNLLKIVSSGMATKKLKA